jgi:ankyrin repeat protein
LKTLLPFLFHTAFRLIPETIFEAIDENDFTHAELLLSVFSPNTDFAGTSAGANPGLRTRKGCQGLAIAACKGLEAAVRTLLKTGADVNDQNPISGFTPMHYAIAKGKVGVVGILMGAGANVMMADRHGRSALDWTLVLPGKR